MAQPTPLGTVGPAGGIINPPAVTFEGYVRIGGKGARCQVGNTLTTLFVKEANLDLKADKEDTSNFEALGYNAATVGLWGTTIDCKGDWDSNLIRFASGTPGLYPRDDLQQKYFINVSDQLFWYFQYSVVLSASTAIPTRSLISFNWNGESNGPFSIPDSAGD